jgi:hypothetical protein
VTTRQPQAVILPKNHSMHLRSDDSKRPHGARRPDDLHRLVRHDRGLIATLMALGFETYRINDRIHCGFADDPGDLLAKAIVFGEIYRDEADLPGVA